MAMSDQQRAKAQQAHRNPWLLLFAVFGGTSAWTVHLIASYTIANYLCGNAVAVWLLHGVTVVAGLAAIAAITLAMIELRRVNDLPERERALIDRRTQFLMSGGVLLGALGLMAIVFGELAVILMGCP